MRFRQIGVSTALASATVAALIFVNGGVQAEETAAPSSQTESAHAGPDGFSICPFASSAPGSLDSTIGPCRPLTGRAMQSFGLSPSQTAIIATLQSFAVKPGFNPLQPMANAKSLAAPKKFVAAGDYSDYWFPDTAQPSNVELGVHLRYMKENAKPELYQMTYTVDGSEGHFTVLWNRVLRTPPPR
jgi:hypothetical protein